MKILGVSPYHDSSVCVVENGKILSFYKEERLSKIKRDMYPFLSIDMAVEDHKDIEIAIICSPSNGDYTLEPIKRYLLKKHSIKHIEDISHEHHLQHASLAFYNSGYKNSLVFVIDRNGSFLNPECRESESIFYAEYPDNIYPIYKSFWVSDMKYIDKSLIDAQNIYQNSKQQIFIDIKTTHGIVKAYESATSLIKQHPLENGKVMGLSAYGSHNAKFDNLYSEHFGSPNKLSTISEDNFAKSVNLSIHDSSEKNITTKNFKLYADYAYAVQTQSQQATKSLIEKWTTEFNCNNVCITGGYGLNVVANQFYKKNLPHINFFYEPIADDTGNSIGGPLLYYRSKTKNNKVITTKDTFFHGKQYDLSRIVGDKVSKHEIVDLLQNQKTIALYYGKSEAGPRALGHRSILFDARNKNAKDIVNRIKQREWYRPFAAVMLIEDAEKYFYVNDFHNAKNMTINFSAKSNAIKDIPGILHVDNTCRIQIIENKEEPLYQLLECFKRHTGVGVLLNTSFNLAGEPLVETPEDALTTLKRSKLDAIWFPSIESVVKNFN